MSKSIALLLVLVLLTASCIIAAKPALSSVSVAEDSWMSKAPMHVARAGLGVAVVNGKIYAIGGFTKNGAVGTNEEYDLATDTWAFKTAMPTPRWRFAVAVYQNKIYCIGGTTEYSDYSSVNEAYDPATDTWETKTPMLTARLGLQANVVNGKIYLTGGLPNNLNEVYDPTNDTWATETPLPTPTGFVSAVVDNKIYAVGTYYSGSYISTTQIYDPDANAWSTGAPPPSSINGGGYAAAAATTGEVAPKRIYVFGIAASVSEPQYFVRAYDPENNSWIFGADPLNIRNEVAISVVNDILYVIGGSTISIYGYETFYATNEQYTPFGYGTVPPKVAVVSPENKTYNATMVALIFSVNKPAVWMGYSLDGRENVTVIGNTTLAGLPSGLHNVTVYARDEFENTGASETIAFTVAKSKPFPTTLVIVSIGSVAIVGLGLLIYLKKRQKGSVDKGVKLES